MFEDDTRRLGLHADEHAPVASVREAETTASSSVSDDDSDSRRERSDGPPTTPLVEETESSLKRKKTKAGVEIEGDRLAASAAFDPTKEAMAFDVACPRCHAPGREQMCVAKIPHFKECVIMSFVCATCGFRDSEIKAGGAVPSNGVVAELRCEDDRDLSRDILKSDTASLKVVELDLELTRGTLGGIYTTVEGALRKIKSNLGESNPFAAGDSAASSQRTAMHALLDKLEGLIQGKGFPFTLILADPVANSFVGPRRSSSHKSSETPLDVYTEENDDHTDDPNLRVEEYARTWEEDEELGLHDIATGDAGSLPVIDELPEGPTEGMVDHPNPDFARGCVDDDDDDDDDVRGGRRRRSSHENGLPPVHEQPPEGDDDDLDDDRPQVADADDAVV